MQEIENAPLVSIIVPAYNAAKFISETITSVLDQSYSNWELIIIDDGSTDHTADAIQPFLSDRRISYYRQQNAGVSFARNSGLEKSKGAYCAFLDADDIWLKENLEMKITFLESDASYDWVFCDMLEYLPAENIVRQAPEGRDDCILENILLWEGEVIPAPPSNIVVRSSCLTTGRILFDTDLSTAADQDFCLQLARLYKGKRLPYVLIKYRVTTTSMSRNIPLMERDHILVYEKAEKQKLFRSFLFKRRCFANLYLILAANWWTAGQNKTRGLYFVIRSLISYPLIAGRYATKLFQ